MSLSIQNNKGKKPWLTVKEITVFAVLGAITYCSKVLMEALPNIHLVGMFVMTFTVAYRKKALLPIYIFVFLAGLFMGFSLWWLPYLYIWTVLWGATMLIPKNIGKKAAFIVYPVVCCLHGLLYGTLFAPCQALMFGFDFKQTLAWIVAGLPWDLLHGIGNFAAGFLVLPLSSLLKKLDK